VLGTFVGSYATIASFASTINTSPIKGEVAVSITSSHVQTEAGARPIAWIEGSVTVTGIPGGTLTLPFTSATGGGGVETQANYPALVGYTYDIDLTATNSNHSDNFYVNITTDGNGRPVPGGTIFMDGVLFDGEKPVDTWVASRTKVEFVPYTPPPPSQVAMDSVSISSDGQAVVATYTIEGRDLPAPDQVGFYWAKGPSVSDEIESKPVYQLATREDVGVGRVVVPIGSFGQEPATARDLIAQVGPDDVTPGRASAYVAAPAPRLAASISNSLNGGIHKILYRGQTLAVPVVLSNSGNATATGNINVRFYLSSNNVASTAGDKPLSTASNLALSVGVGRSQTLQLSSRRAVPTVTIPTDTTVGTWYLKAVITPGSQNSVAIPSGQLVAVSPALHEIDATTGMLVVNPDTHRSPAMMFESGVGQSRANPNYVPPAFATGFTQENLQNYIKGNEGWLNGPYLDSRGVPTIGWGFALNTATAVQQFNALDNTFRRTNNIGWIDPRTGRHMTFSQLVSLAHENGVYIPGHPLRYTIPAFTQDAAGPWWNAEYATHRDGVIKAWNAPSSNTVKFGALPLRVQAVLIDMSYNMGPGYLSDFPNMVGYINAGGSSLAYAGFEMMNSDYSTQVLDRAIRNFRLLVGGYEAYL
jgi:GH24 family phage-related lysozyme (muramidase)